MAGNGVNPGQSQALIVWRDPREILLSTLRVPQFQVLVKLPPFQKCPLDDLNITLEFFYFYADTKPVPKATVVLLSAEGGELMAGPFDQDGYFRLTVPKGVPYQFYIHHDQPPNGLLFNFDGSSLSAAGDPANVLPDWAGRQSVIASQPDVRLHWGYPDFKKFAENPEKPQLEWLIYHVVSKYLPLEGGDALILEASLILEAMLLGQQTEPTLWQRLVLNRFGFALKEQSRILQGLVTCVQNNPAVDLQRLINILNAAGKGNAVDWLRDCSTRLLPAAKTAVANHIDALVGALKTELQAIQQGAPQNSFNKEQAQALLVGAQHLPKASGYVDGLVDTVIQLLTQLTQPHPALRIVRPAVESNVVRQVRRNYPAYTPAEVQLPIWFEMRYCYADKSFVERAKFQVRDAKAPETVIQERDLPADGIGYVQLPAGPSYEFRFHADQAKFACSASEREAAVSPDTSTWIQQAVAGDLFVDGKKLVWKTDLKLSNYEAFAQEPSLSRLLLACVAAKGQPHRKAEAALDDNAADADQAADAAVAGLLRSLLYADKTNVNDIQNWWREISFHRLRAVRPADGSVLERLVALLHDRDDLKLDAVAAWLNTRGKGNVVLWLRETKGKLNDYREEIASNLSEVISAFDGELEKLSQESGKISLPCRVMASRLRERLKKLKPKEGLSEAWTTAAQRWETLLSNENSKKSLRVWTAAKIKDREQYQQKQVNFPRREPPKPPEIPWLEVMFLYADGTPVKKANYKISGGDAPLIGTLDDAGFAFEIGQQNKVYEYEFSDDPNNFSLAQGRKLKAKGADVGANIVDYGIGEGVFKTGGANLVRWGSKFYSSNEDFKLTPDLSQAINTIVRNKTPWIASDDDHKELTAFLFPLIMGKLLEKPALDEVWKACSFQRLGGCLGENGVVVRDLLWWLDQTPDPPLLEAVNRLNSAGNGNAYAHLKTLYGKFDEMEKSVSDNLGSILDAFTLELDKLTGANDSDVIPEMKRFAKEIKTRIQEVKADIPAKVKEALKTARDRLNVLQQKPQPEYKGAAPLMELTIRRQEKIPLAARPAAVPPKLAWFDLEYLHWDDKFVEEAEYVVTDEAGNNILYQGKLSDGYAHLVVPESFKFKYYFRRDKAYAVEAASKGKLNNTFLPQRFAGMTRNAVLLKSLKKTRLTWNPCELTGQKTFRAAPTAGAIATNVMRDAAISPHMLTGNEPQEMAALLHPLLMRDAANSITPLAYKGNGDLWLHAVLNRLSALLGEDGPPASAFLWAVHKNTVYQVGGLLIDANASIKKSAALAHLNQLGRGNAIRWLETLDPLKDLNKNAVATNIDTIFTNLDTEMDALKLQQAVPRKLQSQLTRNYADYVKARILAVRPTVAGAVDAVFVKLKAELQAVLAQPREQKSGLLNQLNLLKQTQAALPPQAVTIPKWIELQYCYKDRRPVPNAQYELHDGGLIKDGNLDAATGFAYLTDVPDTANAYFFKKDNTVFTPRADVANIPRWKKPEGRKQHTIPAPGFRSYAVPIAALGNFAVNGGANWVYNTLYGMFYPPMNRAFGWIDNTAGTDEPTLARFQLWPSIRMLAAKAVQNNTSLCCNYKITGPLNHQVVAADKDPERIEAVNLLQPIVYSGNAALLAVHNNLATWSALVMNRAGATNNGACIGNESRLRKAVLLELGRTNPPLDRLVKLMNSVGKGHAVRWLRKLHADANDVKTGVVNALTAIITELRNECQNGYNFVWAGNNLGPVVRPFYLATRNNCNMLLGGGNIANKVNAVLDPVFVRLGNLLANRPLNPRPFPQAAAVSQLNVFAQKAKQLREVQPTTPPFWNLGPNAITIQVKYEDTAAGNVTADYNVSNANVPQIAATNGTQNFVIPAGAASNGVFFFKHDTGVPDFKAECKPFGNPELPATLGANFLDLAAVHDPLIPTISCFDGKDRLEWEGTVVESQATFQANPTLGQIAAKCVIDRMLSVSGAGDVQDLTVAISRLIRYPAARTDSDEWFRAAAGFAGSQPDHGSVVKGILLRVRKHGELDPEEYFRLINFASQVEGNAIVWLKNQIINPADIGGAAAGLKNILSDLDAQLGKFAGYPDPPVNAALKNFIAGVQAQVQQVHGLVDANVPACFTAKVVPALTRMRAKLPIERPACLGLNLYKREKADMFLESQQSLAQIDKTNIDKVVKDRVANANKTSHPSFAGLAGGALGAPYNEIFNNAKGRVPQTLHQYLGGARGGEAKRLAHQLSTMSNQEFVDAVESLPLAPPVPGWTKSTVHWGGGAGEMGTMTSYEHTDGTLIRYKPHGDEYQRPPAPMYSIEVLDSLGGGAMFKIDPNGNAVPWGPTDANLPLPGGVGNYGGQKAERYKDNVSKAGHRPLRY